jgi:hypothetical protein
MNVIPANVVVAIKHKSDFAWTENVLLIGYNISGGKISHYIVMVDDMIVALPASTQLIRRMQ